MAERLTQPPSDRVVIDDAGNVTPAEGYQWCPDCNGEGEIWVMEKGPDLDEFAIECTASGCIEGAGVVTITHGAFEKPS